MLISVHIPKTGGGSFRTLLEHHFGNRFYSDHGDAPFTKDAETRNKEALVSRGHVEHIAEKYDCVHGHFLPTKYDIDEQNNEFITWIRCPYERVVSRYYFGLRTGDFIFTEKLSITDFCEMEKFHNFYEQYLWNFSLDKFGFVGITEDYEDSIQIFRSQFGVDCQLTERRNVNPRKVTGSKYDIDAASRELIYKYNQADFEIYRQAREINTNLKRKHLG